MCFHLHQANMNCLSQVLAETLLKGSNHILDFNSLHEFETFSNLAPIKWSRIRLNLKLVVKSQKLHLYIKNYSFVSIFAGNQTLHQGDIPGTDSSLELWITQSSIYAKPWTSFWRQSPSGSCTSGPKKRPWKRQP